MKKVLTAFCFSAFALTTAFADAKIANINKAPDEKTTVQTPAEEKSDKSSEKKERVEIIFVLDSTGSMGGLIDGAKKKIWTIANAVALRKPAPELKVGIITYRDKGDEYITKTFELTDDLDKIFQNLKTIAAGGGGDGPESVNQALNEAVTKIAWTDDPEVMKTIFLVGDAPPHMDYQDDVKYPESCKLAAQKGIVINSILCGGDKEAEKFWLEISSKTDGSFAQIDQTGGVKSIATPFDKELAELSDSASSTVVVFGSSHEQRQVELNLKEAKKINMAAVSADAASAEDSDRFEVAASRAAYNAKSGKIVQGRNDLVSRKDVDISKLKDEELPENMRKMTIDERKAYVVEQTKKREEYNKRLNELSVKRDKFIADEQARLIKEGKGDGFDLKVNEMIDKQADKVFKK